MNYKYFEKMCFEVAIKHAVVVKLILNGKILNLVVLLANSHDHHLWWVQHNGKTDVYHLRVYYHHPCRNLFNSTYERCIHFFSKLSLFSWNRESWFIILWCSVDIGQNKFISFYYSHNLISSLGKWVLAHPHHHAVVWHIPSTSTFPGRMTSDLLAVHSLHWSHHCKYIPDLQFHFTFGLLFASVVLTLFADFSEYDSVYFKYLCSWI